MANKFEYISQNEFAKRKEVNRNAVEKALKIGRIKYSTKKDKQGHKLICWDTEKIAWDVNKTSHIVRRSPYTKQKGSKSLIDNEVKEEVPAISDINDEVSTLTPKEPTRFTEEEGIEGKPGTYQYEATRKVKYDANRNKLKYLEEIGKLLPFDSALNMFYKLLNGLRDSVMNYPARCAGTVCQIVESKLSSMDIKLPPDLKIEMKAIIRDTLDNECRNTLDLIQLDIDKDYKQEFLDEQKEHKRGRKS